MKQQLRGVDGSLLALLALTLVGGTGLAGDTLFDADYKVCPRQTREIADLPLARDAEVYAAWTVTNPGNWRLAANAYRASLVAILDDNDGSPVAKSLSLGTRKVIFDQVGTGIEVTVQPVVVMETADGDWLISDILEQTRHRSLTGPAPKGTRGTGGCALVNTRIHDGGHITVPMHPGRAVASRDGALEPDQRPPTMVKVGGFGGTAVGDVFAEPPDRHRNLPNDLLAGDRTCTITAWAGPWGRRGRRLGGRAEGAAGRHRPGSRHRLPRRPTGIDGGPERPGVHRLHRPQAGCTGTARWAFDGGTAETATLCGWPSCCPGPRPWEKELTRLGRRHHEPHRVVRPAWNLAAAPEGPVVCRLCDGRESLPFMLGPVVGGRKGLRMHGTSLDWKFPAVAAAPDPRRRRPVRQGLQRLPLPDPFAGQPDCRLDPGTPRRRTRFTRFGRSPIPATGAWGPMPARPPSWSSSTTTTACRAPSDRDLAPGRPPSQGAYILD